MGNAGARERTRFHSECDSDIVPSLDNCDRLHRISLAGHQSIDVDDGITHDAKELTSFTIPTVFRWPGGGRDVFLTGSFDSWASRIPMVKSHGDFTTIIELPEGQHQYKFLVDGIWRTIATEPQAANEFGSYNNLVTVRHSDFEVFEALACDGGVSTSEDSAVTGIASSPPGSYSQSIPSAENVPARPAPRHGLPPSLPPQLTQVLLNKDTNETQYDASLPEPNHVMLNHLYALSIRDGVMAMGSTHRYRKKYVTTLLYKPV